MVLHSEEEKEMRVRGIERKERDESERNGEEREREMRGK